MNKKCKLKVHSSVVSSKTIERIIFAKGDSAASHHYWCGEDKKFLNDIIQVDGPSVVIPNNDILTSKSQGQLPLSDLLSRKEKTAMILPHLKSASLVSIGQLCDDDWNVFLNKKESIAIKEDKIILKGIRNKYNGLWDISVWKETIVDNVNLISMIHPGIYSAISTKRTTTREPYTWRTDNRK